MFNENSAWMYVVPVVGLVSAVLLERGLLRRLHPRNPPVVFGVPFLGVLPYLKKFPEKVYKKWSLEKYGPVMAINMLGENTVVLNTSDAIKKVFLTKGLASSGRFQSFLFGQLQGNHGITFMDFNKYLEAQKSFGLHFISTLGIAGWETIINSETEKFFEQLETKLGKPFDIEVDLFCASSNILQLILLGRRYDYNHPTSKLFYYTFENILGEEKDVAPLFLIEHKPVLRYLPLFRGAYKRFIKRSEPMMDWIRNVVAEFKDSSEKSNISCFVQHYLQEQKLRNNVKETEFTDEQLVAYVRDVFGAGIKNVSTTLHWLLLCCLLYPDYYEKILKEIEQVLGKNDQPTLKTQSQMPFTCAFIEEVFRRCSPLPKSLAHKLSNDVEVGDFILAKNSKVIGNLWGAHHDHRTWPDPNKFDPFRHMEDGKFYPSHKVIAYSVGPRSCMGEHFARLEKFIIFTRFLQKFEILSADERLPNIDNGRYGITYDPQIFNVILKKRF